MTAEDTQNLAVSRAAQLACLKTQWACTIGLINFSKFAIQPVWARRQPMLNVSSCFHASSGIGLLIDILHPHSQTAQLRTSLLRLMASWYSA